ncbi:SMI1/KNR4 family protein [Nonomuraea sp. NPDC001831]|uniref:SMI1/KNR4 family protein n=1 Tax=Nonomuraea sp. NPDC001831 TaxID=3364340 RepID=UPI0036AC2EC3
MNTQYGWSALFAAKGLTPRSPDGPPPAPGNALHPPAGEAEVSRLEDRLGTALPPSYRQFLLFADGWGDDESGHTVLPAARVGWYRDLEPEAAGLWPSPGEPVSYSVPDELYFVYGAEQDCVNLREEYVRDTLLVGYGDDGEYLLNPHVRTADGEWEAWFLAPWLAGADRHRSFWDLMRTQ